MVTSLALPQIEPRQRQPRSCSTSVPNFISLDRIVGGQDASAPIPWQASIQTSGGFSFCGGTVLDAKTVLCARHCFSNGQAGNNKVVVGSVSKSGTQSSNIASVVINTAQPYNGNTLENDVVILKLETALTMNDNVQAACLPTADYTPETSGKTCVVSGWGTLASGGSTPSTLQWVGVPLITNTVCSQKYSQYGGVTSDMICAGLDQGGKDSCQGDSGGPLVCEENGLAVITGIVSWGIGCAAPNNPGVYGRVTAFLDFINANMEGSTPSPPSPPGPTTAAPPTTAGPTTAAPPTGCGSPNWVGDNFCDDENNNAECNFDGGDCCGDDVNTQYCTACECLEEPTEGCGNPQWEGDNFCDDENNNAGCNFDGGDCCGEDVNTTYCSDCACLEPTTEAPTTTSEVLVGNGFAVIGLSVFGDSIVMAEHSCTSFI